ncbi:MAG: hypothetical protein UHC59_01075 [Fibrobacteraceae bacterium]|nr:hypothetical protein [Fibrobacteraceae bacterium]
MIGYTAPGDQANDGSSSTTNFTFNRTALADDNASAKTEQTDVWTATNKAKLNDCTSAANWTISTGAIGSAGQDSYEAKVASTDCKALTPTFDKIGK